MVGGGLIPSTPSDWTYRWDEVSESWASFPCCFEACTAKPKSKLSVYRGALLYSLLVFCRAHEREVHGREDEMTIRIRVGKGVGVE